MMPNKKSEQRTTTLLTVGKMSIDHPHEHPMYTLNAVLVL